MVPLIIFGVIFLIVVLYIVGTYNRCVRLRNLVPESWSNVDTELKRCSTWPPASASACSSR